MLKHLRMWPGDEIGVYLPEIPGDEEELEFIPLIICPGVRGWSCEVQLIPILNRGSRIDN